MGFQFVHNNINVFDLDASLQFYKDALDLVEATRKTAEDGSFILVYLSDKKSQHTLELTWIRDRHDPYNLGDNESHIALIADDYQQAYARHKKMGCICYENPQMGIYFISDPDGYWLEILPSKQ